MARESVFFQFVGDASDLERAAARARASLERTQAAAASASSKIGSSLKSAGASMSRTGATLTKTVAAPILGVGAAAVKMVADYQTSMNTFQAVSGATAQQMERISAKSKALGRDMSLPGTSAKDAADAMTELAKAGLSVNDTMAASKGVLQLSAAAQIDNASAATITANALGAFGLKGTKATKVADLLAATANSSSAEITHVADALAQSSAVFAQAKIPIEDLTTAIGLMANRGIKGSDAGTSLKTMLMRLQAPSAKAKEKMRDLGISIFDAQGNMRPFLDIVTQFSTRMGDMTQKQKAAALSTIFGSDAVRAASVVLGGGSRAYDKMRQAVTKQGAAADVAAAKMKGIGGAMQGLKSQVETALISFGEMLAPTVEKVTRKIADLVGKFESLSPATKETILKVAAGFAALGPGLFVLGKLTSGLGSLASAFGALTKAPSIIKGLSGALTALGMNPVGLLIAGFVAAGVAIFVFRKQIMAGVRKVADFINDRFPGIGKFVSETWNKILAFTKDVWPQVKEAISHVINVVKGIIRGFVAAGQALWRTFGTNILTIARATWDYIKARIQGTLDIIMGVIRTVLAIINGDWGKAWEGIKQILSGAWKIIWGTVKLALGVLKGIIGAGLTVLAGLFKKAFVGLPKFLFNVGKAILTGLWNGAKFVASLVWGWFRAMPAKILSFYAAAGRWLLGVGKDILRGMWDGLKFVASKVWEWIRGIPGRILGFFKDAPKLLFDVGKQIIQGLWDGLKNMWEKAKGWVGSIGGWIRDLKGPPSKDRRLLYDVGQLIIRGLGEGMRKEFRSTEGLIRQISGGFERLHERLARFSDELKRSSPLRPLAQELTRDAAHISARLADLQGRMSEFSGGIRGGFAQGADLVSTLGSGSETGAPTGASDVAAFFKTKIAEAREFARVLKSLARQGLNRGLLQRLGEAGPESLGLARAISTTGVGQVNRWQNQLDALASTTSKTVTAIAFKPEIAAASKELARFARKLQAFNDVTGREPGRGRVTNINLGGITINGGADRQTARVIADQVSREFARLLDRLQRAG